jgi:hypothetical protein
VKNGSFRTEIRPNAIRPPLWGDGDQIPITPGCILIFGVLVNRAALSMSDVRKSVAILWVLEGEGAKHTIEAAA